MEIAIISIVAAVLLAMYVVKSRDYKQQERDNKWLDGQHENMQAPVAVDDVDSHQLDKETAMEAIRYNGYVPDADDRWIIFTVRGEQYAIDSGRFPVMVLMKHYSLGHNERDMDTYRLRIADSVFARKLAGKSCSLKVPSGAARRLPPNSRRGVSSIWMIPRR